MVIIKIKAIYIRILIAILLLCSLGFNVYNYQKSVDIENRYETINCFVNQFGMSNMISFLASVQTKIEIFDITKGEVIKKAQSNSIIQNEVEGYLNAITGMYAKVKAFPEKGYIIKIPLDPNVKIENHWLNDYEIYTVNEVFILLPEQGQPYLLVLDKKKRPLFYNFEGSINLLLEELNFKLGASSL